MYFLALMLACFGELICHLPQSFLTPDKIKKKSFYITECTWMRKHGWRTPEWKVIKSLEPDFHFKPEYELFNLKDDPNEIKNLAESNPEKVKHLLFEMNEWLEKRKKTTGFDTPIYNQGDWHGHEGVGSFKSSQQAYDTLRLLDAGHAKRLQAKSR